MKFELLTPAHFQRLKPHFANQRYELCEYCLTTILSWSTDEYRPHATITQDGLIIAAEYKTFPADRHLILPVSPPSLYPPERLHKLADETGYDKFWFVTDGYINEHSRTAVEKYFTITEQQGTADYIYLTEDLVQLSGNRYAKKRNLIHQFEAEYIDRNRVILESITAANSQACLDFLEEWCEQRDCEEKGDIWFACEKEAAANAITNIELFDTTKGLLLRIDGKVSAFGLVSPLTATMAVLQFEKAFEHIKGLYQYFDNQCCRLLCRDFRYVNKESDLNLPGLIQSKKSYHPLRYVTSYELQTKK
jgi:hypothetical protein